MRRASAGAALSDPPDTSPSEIAREFGKKARDARRLRGIHQSVLADRLGIAQPSISRIENGLVNPTLSACAQIAEALGCTLVLDLITDGRPISENIDVTELDDIITTMQSTVRSMMESIRRLEEHREKIASTRNMP